MSESKYTKGPWHVSGGNVWSDTRCVAVIRKSVYAHDEELVANARLIAAAPELLEACKAACQAASDCLPPSGEGELDALYYKAKLLAIDEAAAKCSAAIAKCE